MCPTGRSTIGGVFALGARGRGFEPYRLDMTRLAELVDAVDLKFISV